MTITAILALVARLIPVVETIVSTLHAAHAVSDKTAETVALIERLTPAASTMLSTIETIRTQTEADYPAVWAPIRDDWNATVAKWTKLNSTDADGKPVLT